MDHDHLEGKLMAGSQSYMRGVPEKESDLAGLQRRDYTEELEKLEAMLKASKTRLSQREILVKLGYPEYNLVARNFMKNFMIAATHALRIWEDDNDLIGILV